MVFDQIWKSVIGFILPGAVIVGSAVTSESAGGSHITGAEWVTAVVACIVTAGGVYAVPNDLIAKRRAHSALDGQDGTDPLDGP